MFQNSFFYLIAIGVFLYYRNKYTKKAKNEIDDYHSKNKKADS